MPNVLEQLNAIFVFVSNLPHPVISNLVMEAAYSGIGIITDRQNLYRTYESVFEIKKNQVLVVSPTETEASAQKISEWLHERENTVLNPIWKVSFQDYLLSQEILYEKILIKS
ncbi:hypothetical protein ACFLUU_06515 [Chloroflexota bacterium]